MSAEEKLRKLLSLLTPLLVVALIMGCGGVGKATLTPTFTPAPMPTSTPAPTPSLTPTPDAAAIRERASLAVAAANSYRLERKILASIATQNDSKSPAIRVLVTGDMALDVPGHKMRMKNSRNVELPPGQAAPPVTESSIYIVGNVLYIKGLFPDEPQQWVKTSVPENYWQIQNQAKQLTELLKLSEVAVLPPETTRDLDVPSHVLQVAPKLEGFWELVAQQPGIGLPPQPPPGVALSQIVRSRELKLWLAQTTGLPLKVEMRMKVQMGPVAQPSGERSMDIVVTMLFYDYNQPVSIELPAEAEGAEELIPASSP